MSSNRKFRFKNIILIQIVLLGSTATEAGVISRLKASFSNTPSVKYHTDKATAYKNQFDSATTQAQKQKYNKKVMEHSMQAVKSAGRDEDRHNAEAGEHWAETRKKDPILHYTETHETHKADYEDYAKKSEEKAAASRQQKEHAQHMYNQAVGISPSIIINP